MVYEFIVSERQDSIAILRLNRDIVDAERQLRKDLPGAEAPAPEAPDRLSVSESTTRPQA